MTMWIGGRLPSPLFVGEDDGYQADIIVWLDLTRDLVVGLCPVAPSEPAASIGESLPIVGGVPSDRSSNTPLAVWRSRAFFRPGEASTRPDSNSAPGIW